MPRPSIHDVAVHANVSIATVSHVINETRFVSVETRQRVLDAIEVLGYHPSASARSLASNKTNIVGVVFSDITNPFFPSVFKGIEDQLVASGYDLLLANTAEKSEKQEAALKTMFARQVDGLLLAPTGKPSETLEALVKDKTPVVLIDRRDPNWDLPLVSINNEEASFEAVKHLIEDGHTHIGFIMGIESISTSIERFNGYKRALETYGIPYNPDYLYQGKSTLEDGLSGVKHILAHQKQVSAIFTTNNMMTLGALNALKGLRIRVPEDIGLIGFDDHDWADIFTPPITVVSQPTYELGEAAASLLERMMQNEDEIREPVHQVLEAKLIRRASCSARCWQDYVLPEPSDHLLTGS